MDLLLPDKLLNEARLYINEGKYEDALKSLDEAIEANPDISSHWCLKGFCLTLIGENKKAISTLEVAIELDPTLVFAWNTLGMAYSNLNQYEKSLIFFEKAIELNESSSLFWNNKSLALIRIGKFNEALKAIEKSIELQPNTPLSWNNKGVIFLHMQKYEKALDAFENEIINNERILQKADSGESIILGSCSFEDKLSSPMNISSFDDSLLLARHNKALTLLSLGRNEDALKLFEIVLKSNENFSPALFGKGVALYGLLIYSESIITLEKFIERNPKSIHAYIYLSQIFFENSVMRKALEIVENGLEIDNNNSSLWSMRGRIKIEEQQYGEAVTCFDNAISFDIHNKKIILWKIYAKYLEAELLTSNSKLRYQDTISSIVRELERIHKPEYGTEIGAYVCYFLGYFYYKLNDFYKAKERLEECLSLEADLSKMNLNEDSLMTSTNELLSKIWDYGIRPHWWNWWLCSPIHKIRRIITFSSIFLSILILSLIHPLIGQVYSNVSWNIFILLILFLIFILISPSISRIRSTDIEIEMQEPLKMEISSIQIEDLINQLEMDCSYVEIE